jgi:tetratricopeptide (TPR) repeat protein
VSRIALCVLVVASLLARPALGADRHSEAEARKHYTRATKLYNLGKFPEAIKLYEKAYELRGDAVFLFNIGQAHRLQGDLPQALFFYRSYLRNAANPPNQAEVEARIAEIEKALAQPLVGPPAPTAALAQPLVGPPAPTAALAQPPVNPPAPTAALAQPPVDPHAPTAALAQPLVDPPAAPAALAQPPVDPPAPPTPTLPRPEPAAAPVAQASATTAAPVAAARPGWGWREITGTTLVGAGLAALGTGILAHVARNARAGDFNQAGCYEHNGQGLGPAGCAGRLDGVDSARDLAIFGYVSAAVLGGGAAYLLLTAAREPSIAPRRASLTCAPAAKLGLVCQGSF